MKNIKYLRATGLLMLTAGVLLLLYYNIPVLVGKVLFSLSVFASGIYAYLFAASNRSHNKAYMYHFIQAIGLVGFSVFSFMFYNNDAYQLIVTLILMGTIGLVEFVYALGVMQDKMVENKRMLYTRLISGLVNTLGSITLLVLFLDNVELGTFLSGCLVALGGISFVIFSNKIK